MTKTTKVDDVLETRGRRYGDYSAMAAVAQAIKAIVRKADGLKPLPERMECHQTESLELIATKIARIAVGDHLHADSWRDIEGYAKLVADRLEGGERR